MPNGVICGGAVDGSNQLGEIVTCHAITARPDGAARGGCRAGREEGSQQQTGECATRAQNLRRRHRDPPRDKCVLERSATMGRGYIGVNRVPRMQR